MTANSLIHRLPRHLKMGELRVFVAVLEHRSFRKAAAVLHLTQPAITKAIAGLEEHAGLQALRPPGQRRGADGARPQLRAARGRHLRRAAPRGTGPDAGVQWRQGQPARGHRADAGHPLPAGRDQPPGRRAPGHPRVGGRRARDGAAGSAAQARHRGGDPAPVAGRPGDDLRVDRCSTRSCAWSPARTTRWPPRAAELARAAATALGDAAGGLLLLRARAAHARPGWTCPCRARWSRRCRSSIQFGMVLHAGMLCFGMRSQIIFAPGKEFLVRLPFELPVEQQRRRRRDAEVARAQPAGAAADARTSAR